MYKNRKFNKIAKENSDRKRLLNTIGEDTTIKITRVEVSSSDTTDRSANNEGGGALEEVLSSEENIPASQEPTQRYLSQRSNIASTLMRTQSRNATHRPPNTYFELVLIKSGVQLDEGDNFVLSCDHVAFVSKFREIFVKSPNHPENVETFKTGLRDALAVKSKLAQKLLSGCTISAPGEESVYQSQDSMIVNFLMIDFLRDHVLEVLLDKIDEAAGDSSMLLANNNIPLLPLMLAQLRYVTLSHGELIYTRIKEIFDRASECAKLDIIANSEFVLDSSKHDEFTQLLLDNMPERKDFFRSAIIQTLTNLCLSAKMQRKLRSKILAYIKDNQCPDETIPMLVKFLLKSLNEDNDEAVRELIQALREILISITNSDTNSLNEKPQMELFNFIEQGLTRSKRFYFLWQKTIASLPAIQFRSFDFLILLLLIHIKEDNSLYIENILRRRIKLEQITVEILNETKTKYAAVLAQHTNTLMQILHDFMKEKHKAVADFARSSYGILFQICDSVQKNILKKLLELTCDKSTHNMTSLALELLKDLQRKYPRDVQNWGMLLMPLLDRLNEMNLSQTRLVMELLCSIAYPATSLSECPALQDQIDMLVKKQMINRTAAVKKQGIIGTVQLIDSIARIGESGIDQDDFDASYNTVNDLPDGRGKMAAKYVQRVYSSTQHCAESLALFYDELASVCAASPADRTNKGFLDKPFLIWLCELTTHYFQDSFVTEHDLQTTFGIKLSCQKCINSVEDTNTEDSSLAPIAINISELVLKPSAEASTSILVLAPIFNLVRVLHLQRSEGSLEQINALLGCGIILPTFFDDENSDAIFFNYDEHIQNKILDIYFHCINWIRETVSSFATQQDNMLRKKVLQRLADLIQIEAKVHHMITKAAASYVPPMCQFIKTNVNSGAIGGRGRPASSANSKDNRRSKARANQTESEAISQNVTSANITHIADITTKLAGAGRPKAFNEKNNFVNLYGPKEVYRQMDTGIVLILAEELNIKFPLPQEDLGNKIGLLEFRFILTDLVCKLESLTGVQKFQNEPTLQYIAKPYYFMCDLSKFLPKIVHNMQMISSAIAEQLVLVKHVNSHADLFTEEFSYLKVCYGLCLHLLAAYFSWSEFADGTRNDLLKESLMALLDPTQAQQLRGKAPDALTVQVFQKYITYEATVVDLESSVHLYQLVVILQRLSNGGSAEDSKKRAHEIRSLCKTLLCRKWFNYEGTLEKGATCNIYLDILVKGFLKDSDFRRQHQILRNVLEESKQLGGKDSSLKTFPNFKKANFPLLFRGLCEILISSVSVKISTKNGEDSDELKVWEKSCELLNTLLVIVESLDVPRNFQLFLKHSHLYLKFVLQHGLVVYEQYLRQNPERVSALLKELQLTTRFLHNLCCHSKALKNTAIVSQIPFLRETVENLVFRVKALLAANKCASVFWMGNLKNKDLHGDDILSQAGSLTSAVGQDSDGDIPDDVSVDETIIGHDESMPSENEKEGVSTRSNRSKSSSRSKCF